MAITNKPTEAFKIQYRESFILLLQQLESRLRGAVDIQDQVDGKMEYFDRLGTLEAHKIVTRYSDTPLDELPYSRRRAILEDFDVAPVLDKYDLKKMSADPSSKTVRAGVGAMNRKIDDIIISAALGTADAVDADEAATAIALPAAQKIAVAATRVTLAKILNANEILNENEEDPDAKRWLVIDPKDVTALLNENKLTSADYVEVKSLQTGRIAQALGFNIIMTNRLTLDSNGDDQAFAFTQGAIGLAIGQDVQVEHITRVDKRMTQQMYTSMSLGAVRVEDEKVVEIAADN